MRSETILVIDDDHFVLRLITQVLTRSGYAVLSALGPDQAMEAFAQHQSEIALVICDVVMPKLNGPDLVERFHSAKPGLAVLFISGYTNSELVRTRILERGRPLLSKPFTVAALLGRTEEILGRGSNAVSAG